PAFFGTVGGSWQLLARRRAGRLRVGRRRRAELGYPIEPPRGAGVSTPHHGPSGRGLPGLVSERVADCVLALSWPIFSGPPLSGRRHDLLDLSVEWTCPSIVQLSREVGTFMVS